MYTTATKVETCAPCQIKFVRDRKHVDGDFRTLVRMAKKWRNYADKPLKSFLIELIMARLLDTRGKGASIEQRFRDFLLYIAQSGLKEVISFPENIGFVPQFYDPVVIIDPVANTNNVASRITEIERQDIVAAAQGAWETANFASTENDHAVWKELFGPQFRTGGHAMSAATATRTATYTAVDVEKVVRRVKADLTMIADSTSAWTGAEAADYAHDIELLAEKDFLAWVDVTLFSGAVELRAARFNVDTDAGSLTSDRPGGVLWPRVTDARLRIVIGYTEKYTDEARRGMKGRLRIGWTANHDDTSHAALSGSGGRDYASNAFRHEAQGLDELMTENSIFDSETVVPNAALAARAQTLLGFERRHARVQAQLRLLLNADAVGEWNRRYHRGELVIGDRVADQYPLIVFHGDVGTGKTVTAECLANRLMTDSGIEDCTLFKLSNRVRGGGMGRRDGLAARGCVQAHRGVGRQAPPRGSHHRRGR